MLEVSGLSADYGSFRALFEVSLAVDAGETVAVIGPNGAGKTTLMRVISGMLPPHSGELRFEGRPIAGLTAHRIVELGIAHVPENRRLFPRLTVEENLRMGAYLPSARASFAVRLDWAYDHFPRLRERRHQVAGTLSGGEQQMCAIARALMSKPRLLLLDEPSAGLAPLVVQQVFDLVRRHRRGRLHSADRRAERAASARPRRSRLFAGGGPHRARGLGRRAQRERGDPPLLSGALAGAPWTYTSSKPS